MSVLVSCLFYGLVFAIISTTFSKTKSFFEEKKYIKAIFCVLLILIEVIVATLIHRDMKTWQKEQLEEKISSYTQEKKSTREKTLDELAVNAPLPHSVVSGMKKIDLDELSLMFDTAYVIPTDSKYFLGCWIDSYKENALQICFFDFSKKDLPDRTSFALFDEKDYKDFIQSMKQKLNSGEYNSADKFSFIDDGYFKVNGNVIIWIRGIVTYSDMTSSNAFHYFVWKRNRLYFISYFTSDDSSEPNDTILTSLNSLELK
ncbi:MAG: hypothetical protein IKE46_05810 [Selenomonadaceae bacterium]|nr:hypothetical protein [Selenomonadaceae bacterium]